MTPFHELPNPQRRAVELVKEVAAEKNCRPFLVGGPVRDLLLGRQVSDVDLTLEDGSSILARALAKRLEGRVRSFPQFLTYKVTADGLPDIDIATTRKERYRQPGALPAVSAGKLKDDLVRRDFSINAIAIDLDRGSMHDPTHGEDDLGGRVIRVLHDDSFADDPTRIFRAIRLARRLGFTIEPHTAALIRAALAGGALSHISRERIWRELFLAMNEAMAPEVLVALEEQGVLDIIFGQHPRDLALQDRLERIRLEAAANPDLDHYVLYTSALLRGAGISAIDLEGSGFSQKRAKNVLQIARDLGRFEEAVAEAKSERHRFRLFRTVSPEMLSVVAAEKPDERPHLERFREYREFRLPLRGTDLEVPPGPHIKRALERTREAVFSGEVSQDAARAFARDLAMQYLGREAERTS